jgi:hypothetical protein
VSKDTDDDLNDKLYQPPKRSNALDNEAPECIYTSNGEEVISETEYGCELVSKTNLNDNPSNIYQREKKEIKQKRKASNQPKDQPPKKKALAQEEINRQPEKLDNDDDIDSGGESDGRSALRGVEAKEAPRAAHYGPGNASLQHFCDPVATVDRPKALGIQVLFLCLVYQNTMI